MRYEMLQVTRDQPPFDFRSEPSYCPELITMMPKTMWEFEENEEKVKWLKVYDENDLIFSIFVDRNPAREWSFSLGWTGTVKLEWFSDSYEKFLAAYEYLKSQGIQIDILSAYSANGWDLTQWPQDFGEAITHILPLEKWIQSFGKKLRNNLRRCLKENDHLKYRQFMEEKDFDSLFDLNVWWNDQWTRRKGKKYDYELEEIAFYKFLWRQGALLCFGLYDKDRLIGADSMLVDGDKWLSLDSPYYRNEYKVGDYLVISAITELQRFAESGYPTKYSLGQMDSGKDDFFKSKFAHEIHDLRVIGLGRWELRETVPDVDLNSPFVQIREDYRYKWKKEDDTNKKP